ncbi:MAG: Ig-like domain-containing protein, partial [Bacteroidetes bacterium]|nr:Ig-like domain-containing protein [Bacteroidota bacterium]
MHNNNKICGRFIRLIIMLAFLIGLFKSPSLSQNLINTGEINNTGLLRVKNQAIGLPTQVGGKFELFGADQLVPARQYKELILTGSGSKVTSGGNFTVSDSVIIISNVILQVENGSVITLNGYLREQGYLSGSIQKTVQLSNSQTSSDFGNIGATISWSGTAPGNTIVTRTSGISQMGNGFESVKRYYDIVPTTNSGLSASLILQYSDQELNGHDPTKLLLWKSIDGGHTWIVQGGTIDISSRTMTKHGVTSFGRWTFADSLHPLGSLRPIGILAIVSGSNQSQPINTTLQPFDVVVTDSEGTLLAGETVVFSIVGFPQGAAGQVLNQTVVQTGSNGIASTTLTLGNKVGTYTVTATSGTLTGSPVTFSATATVGAAATIALTSGNDQS